MDMNLRDLQYFAVVAKHRHLGRAAEALGLSQPAVSVSLRRLEQFMRTKLVKRTPKGVELTAAGEVVLAHASRLRLSIEDISREVADLSEGRAGHLRIGTGAGSALHLVPAACAVLLKEAPKVSLKIVTGGRQGMLTGLGNGELDVVVTTIQAFPHSTLCEDALYDQTFVVFASVNHPLTKRKQVSLADLTQERWALSPPGNFQELRLSELLGKKALPAPTGSLETTNITSMLHLVAASELLGFAPRQTVRYAVAHRYPISELRVKDLSVTRRTGVIYRTDVYLSPVTTRFIEILKATAEKMVTAE
jgi:DNA-binding transcriptional LysR family regulator